MEEVATAVVRLISDDTRPDAAEGSCVLVRCFVTIDRGRLPTRLARMVEPRHDDDPDDQFLVLLATEGIEAEWCDRRRSRDHQVLPLAGSAISMTSPMITRMFRQFGCPLPTLTTHGAAFVEPGEHAFGVFHVEEASGSSAVPGQDFVAKYRVASVVGLGGRLPTGDVFAVLIFSRDPIDRHIAALLQPWALSIKLAFLTVFERVFADEAATELPHLNTERRLRVEVATLRTLLELQEALLSGDHRKELTAAGTDVTHREQVILELVATGATNKQIAANLDLSPGTVKWHIYNLFQKLGVKTRTEAVVTARQQHLIR